MAKTTRTTGSRKSLARKVSPAKKAAKPRNATQPVAVIPPAPLPVESHVALATTFPVAGDAEISQMAYVGRPMPAQTKPGGGVVAFLRRLFG